MADRKVTSSNRYAQILGHIFLQRYEDGAESIAFTRLDIEDAAKQLEIRLPKNLGDVIYSFRYRTALPAAIADRAPPGKVWVIRPAGRSQYLFAAVSAGMATIRPNPGLVETKIPNATPGVIEMYSLTDEQALLAVLRYNRLIDLFIFSGRATRSYERI